MQSGNADYYHARQSCYVCLNPHDGVDTEVQIDYEGVLFLCRNCVREMAVFLGFDVDNSRQGEIDSLKAKIAELDALAEDRETTISALIKDQHNHRKMEAVRAAKATKVDA
jgi:ribosomal protein S14